MSTASFNRRKILAGLAALPATGLAGGVALSGQPEDDAELRALWAEYVAAWTGLQTACEAQDRARRAAHQDKQRLRAPYFYDHIDPADPRARRRWVVIEMVHPNNLRQKRRWRRRTIPGCMCLTDAIAFAKQRLAAEMEVYRRQIAEINSWYGVYVCDAQCDALRERLSELRKAIKRVPAKTVFGVGVRLVTNSHQWDDDHHETFFSTLETVGKLSGVQFRLPSVRL